MTAKLPELRRDQRYHAAVPVFLGGAMGATRDMSASGVYFWREGMCMCVPGESISFSIELQTAKGRMLWKCRGSVVRVEPLGDMVGVAAKITESTMEVPWTDVIGVRGVGGSC